MKDKQKIYLSLSALGLEMGLALAIFVFLGNQLDKYFSLAPWGIIGGGIMGLITAFRLAYQKIKKIQEWIKKDD